jgi:hypothetical protein
MLMKMKTDTVNASEDTWHIRYNCTEREEEDVRHVECTSKYKVTYEDAHSTQHQGTNKAHHTKTNTKNKHSNKIQWGIENTRKPKETWFHRVQRDSGSHIKIKTK